MRQTHVTLVEQNPSPVMRLDAHGVIIYANSGALTLLATWGAEVGDRVPEPWASTIEETVRLARPRDLELQVGPWSFLIHLVPTPDGGHINFYGMDITERKIAEMSMRKSEKKYRELYENLRDAAAAADMSGRITECNTEFLEMLGYTREEIFQLTVKDITPQKWWAEESRIMRSQVMVNGYSEVFEKEYVHKDGHLVPVELRAYLLRGEQGQPTGVMAFVREVTERKKTEEQLRLAASVFQGSTDGIIITDPQGKILDVNAAFTEITGYTHKEALGKTPNILKSDRHRLDFYQNLWKNLKEKGSWRGEIWNRRKSGEIFPIWETISAVKNADGLTTHYVGIFSDITTVKRAEERLHYLAHYDPLTGLPNRLLFRDRLDRAITQASRSLRPVALMYLDLDGFKIINDSLGHRIGDELLIQMSARIREGLRDGDTLARLGGDEFAVILPDIQDSQGASGAARRIIQNLAKPFTLDRHEVVVTASIGVTLFPMDGRDKDLLLQYADIAMYHAKEAGRNNFQFYTAEMNVRALERLKLENSLRLAVEQKQFILHYQPRVDLRRRRLIGMEALVRWEQPEYGLISPSKFIPIAEETGLIVPLGEWVLRTACRQAKEWTESGLGSLRVAVNLSSRQFRQPDLVDMIAGILTETGLNPNQLELELTESMIMQDVDLVIDLMTKLKKMGLYLSIDDFGTGYSSLNYLKRFPIDILKVDQSFVQDMTENPGDRDIVRAIIALGHSLQLTVLAEGVENEHQLILLLQEDCDEVQGYYFSRPLTTEEFALRVLQGQGWWKS